MNEIHRELIWKSCSEKLSLQPPVSSRVSRPLLKEKRREKEEWKLMLSAFNKFSFWLLFPLSFLSFRSGLDFFSFNDFLSFLESEALCWLGLWARASARSQRFTLKIKERKSRKEMKWRGLKAGSKKRTKEGCSMVSFKDFLPSSVHPSFFLSYDHGHTSLLWMAVSWRLMKRERSQSLAWRPSRFINNLQPPSRNRISGWKRRSRGHFLWP